MLLKFFLLVTELVIFVFLHFLGRTFWLITIKRRLLNSVVRNMHLLLLYINSFIFCVSDNINYVSFRNIFFVFHNVTRLVFFIDYAWSLLLQFIVVFKR